MRKSKYCSYCDEGTLKDLGGYRVCDYCSLIMWTGRDVVPSKAELKDEACPNCRQKCFHVVGKIRTKQANFNLMRCSICDASAIEVPSGATSEARRRMSRKQD